MNLQDHKDLADYEFSKKAKLQHWQAMHQHVLHSDRAAVDIGLAALKAAILVNAGAVVALLAFVGQLWDSKDINATVTLVAIFSKVTPFTYGLIFAVAGASVAYFYQSFATATFDHALKKISAGGDAVPPQKVLTVVTGLFAIVMIGLVIASFIFFGIGTLGVKAALGA